MQISENKTLVLYWYNEHAVKGTQTTSNNFVRLPFISCNLSLLVSREQLEPDSQA